MARGNGEKTTGRDKPKSVTTKPAVQSAAPDEILWRHVAATIKPLKSRRRPPAKALAASREPDETPAKPQTVASPPSPRAAKPSLPELTTSAAAGIDKRTNQRLGRGLLAIEGRLDLHGLTQDQAHQRLNGFIRRAVAAGKRSVLVITGKGYKPTGETGVLRQAVPRWLNEPALRRHIVALRHAQPKDGGEGALYLLLRRDRETAMGKDKAPVKRLARKRRES